MGVKTLGIIIAVIVILGIGYYVYSHTSVLSGLQSIAQSAQPTVNIAAIQANPTSYLNKTIYVRAELEDEYGTSIAGLYYFQNGIQNQLYQYFSSNQTDWYLALTLPNQPNREWQYGSTYLFAGHVSILYGCGGSLAYGYTSAINGTCHSNTADYWGNIPPTNRSRYYCSVQANNYGGDNYTCYPASPAIALYYFNATNATLNG